MGKRGLSLFLLLLAACAAPAQSPGSLSFALMGDTPCSAGEAERLERRIDDLNAEPLAFVLHIGDQEKALRKKLSERRQTPAGRYPSSMTMLPPASSSALAPGGTTQVASYSSMIKGPFFAWDKSDRRMTGVSIHEPK